MPFELKWLVPGQILYVSLQGDVTVAETDQIVAQATDTLDQATGPVHFVADFRQLVSLPTGKFVPTPALQNMFGHVHFGWTAFLGTNPMLSFLFKVFLKIFNFRSARFNAVEEAQTFLQQINLVEANKRSTRDDSDAG